MIIIGEKINATIPEAGKMIEDNDADGLLNLMQRQMACGATHIDVNVGTGKGSRQDEMDHMQWAVSHLREQTQAPLCIDSADPWVIEAGLQALNGGKGMINSTKAEDDHMNAVLPLAARYNVPIVALAMDEGGIPASVEGRLAACEKVAVRSREEGLALENVFFDPLVLPVSTDRTQGKITLDTLAGIRRTFPEAKTVMGLSNVSYGLPGRTNLNAAFLLMAIYAGLDAVIINPMKKAMMDAIFAGEALVGKDRHFRRYMRYYKKSSTGEQKGS